MTEKRLLKRYTVRLKVYRQDNGALLGYAEDMNVKGMMLMSKDPIADKQEINIWFGADNTDLEENKIVVTGYKSGGAFTDTVPRRYSSGWQCIAPSNDAMNAIEELINELDGVYNTHLCPHSLGYPTKEPLNNSEVPLILWQRNYSL